MPAKQRPARGRQPPRPLSERERRWVEAFMGEAAGNATKAARLAGYRGNAATLATQGRRLLRKAQIQEAIKLRVAEDPAIATRQERQAFWTRVMLGRDEFKKARLADRLKAAELLGKSQGDFIEKHEHRFPRAPSLVVEVAR